MSENHILLGDLCSTESERGRIFLGYGAMNLMTYSNIFEKSNKFQHISQLQLCLETLAAAAALQDWLHGDGEI